MINEIISKYKNLSKPIKASIWFTICNIIQRGFQFLSMPIFTRLMSQEEYGTYSVFLSWFNIVCIFTSLNIYAGVYNKAMIKFEDKRNEYTSSIQTLTCCVTLIFCFLILLGLEWICKITGFSSSVVFLMMFHLMCFPMLQYWSQEQRFKFEYRNMLIVTLLNSGLSFVLGIAALFLFEEKGDVLIAVTVLVQCFICLPIGLNIWKKGKVFFHKEFWKWSVIMAIPLIPHYLSEVLLGHSDRLMIDYMCGSDKAGIYNIVYQISMVMTIIRTGINGAFAPWLYNTIKKKEYLSIRSTINMLAVFMASLSLIVMLLGPEILKIIAPSSYYEAVIDIPAIMVGGFYIFVYVLFVYVEIYYEKNQYVAIASIIATCVNIFLNMVCIPQFGYLAAGYTTMISYALMAILHLAFLFKLSNDNKEILSFFNFKLLGCISIGFLIVIPIMLVLYKYWLLRGIVFLLMVVALIRNYNKFLNMLKQMKG